MTTDADGYGARPGQSDIDRLLEDARTLSPLGVERAAQGWLKHARSGTLTAWEEAERTALEILDSTRRQPAWEELHGRILGLTEDRAALVAWRLEHGEVGHHAESALLGAALALMAQPQLDGARTRTLTAPMAEALPWLSGGGDHAGRTR